MCARSLLHHLPSDWSNLVYCLCKFMIVSAVRCCCTGVPPHPARGPAVRDDRKGSLPGGSTRGGEREGEGTDVRGVA